MKFLTTLTMAVGTLALMSGSAFAAAAGTFDFNAGVAGAPNTDIGSFTGNGSWFGMDPGGSVVRTNMAPTTTGTAGLQLSATESYVGTANNYTLTNIDNPWSFFFNQGIHFSTGSLPMTVSGTTASVNMNNWWVAWGNNGAGLPIEVPMGAGVDQIVGTADDFMTISAGLDGLWNTGDEYADYAAQVPNGDPSGFGNAPYNLHLEGTFNAVPEPMSMALVGSSIIGLVVLRRRMA